ncbi:MAG: response regulator [bacterium]|nr:response regulator [bacterium]MDY4100193.1 response regulator [Lachnospiraceae bacterium]
MNVVYMIVRSVQFLIFLLSFVLVYRIYQEKNTTKQRILLLASICAVLNIYGYLEALSTMSEQSSQWAVRSQYVSSLLFLVFMLHLIALFCDLHIRKWAMIILWTLNAIFATILFVDETFHILFDHYTFTGKLLAVQIQFELLPMGYVFMAYMALLAAAVLYVGTVIRQEKKRDGVITIIAFVSVLHCLAYLLDLAGLTGGFDFGPTLMMSACWLTYHFNKNYHFLDDGQIARETILDELGEGYIILDSNRNVKSYNSIAAMLCPELEQQGESEAIVELIYLHNHDMLEHNGKMCNIVVSELKENGTLTGYVMWMYDCTDEYYYMRDLEQIQAHATASDKTRNLFLHHMTHGFGSPLHIIKNRSDAICQDERTSEDVREMSLEVLEAGQKLEDMVAVMLDYSPDQRRKTAMEHEYKTSELAQSLRSLIEERRQGRCQQIEMTVSPQLPVNWYGDRKGVERVLAGILRCAGMSSRISGILLEVASEMRYADALLILTLYLDDKGMLTGELNRLSALAQRSDKQTESEVNYIPYSLCKRLLLEMKGTMECSVDRNRSKVVVMFPQRVVDNAPYGTGEEPEIEAQAQSLPEERKQQELKQPTVLVVDDNLLYLKEMDGWLHRLKLKTIMAKNGLECLRILERKDVDLIFMDQMMPGMDGTQVLEKIREREKESGRQDPVPVVLLTADDSVGARKRYLEAGFNDYLSKPIEPKQICEEVEKFLHM